MTLTLAQGHFMGHHFKALPIGYIVAKFQISTLNSVGDIIEVHICGEQIILTLPF